MVWYQLNKTITTLWLFSTLTHRIQKCIWFQWQLTFTENKTLSLDQNIESVKTINWKHTDAFIINLRKLCCILFSNDNWLLSAIYYENDKKKNEQELYSLCITWMSEWNPDNFCVTNKKIASHAVILCCRVWSV